MRAEHQKLAGLRIYQKAQQLSRLITDMGLVASFDKLGPNMPQAHVDLVELLEPMVKELQRRFADLAIDLRLAWFRLRFVAMPPGCAWRSANCSTMPCDSGRRRSAGLTSGWPWLKAAGR